jgi:hypothetical protein
VVMSVSAGKQSTGTHELSALATARAMGIQRNRVSDKKSDVLTLPSNCFEH